MTIEQFAFAYHGTMMLYAQEYQKGKGKLTYFSSFNLIDTFQPISYHIPASLPLSMIFSGIHGQILLAIPAETFRAASARILPGSFQGLL